MSVKIREIDGRNQLFGIMKYQAVISLPLFFSVREWCWETWGTGIEYEHFRNYFRTTGIGIPWSWDCSKFQGASISNGKIYLKDDDQKALFMLTWGGS